MDAPHPTQSESLDKTPSGSFREGVSNAIRFWEPRRLIYTLVLSTVALIWVVATWPHFRVAFTLFSLLRLSILALLANVCYCAAYLVEIPIQCSVSSAVRNRLRWGLWLLGTLFAVLFENYWIADEIYPFVN